MGRGGKLDINIDSVRLADGEKAALRGVKELKGGGHTGAMTGAMVATSLVVWPAAPFFLFMHGKEVTIPKGTELSVYINGDMNLDPVKFGAKPASEAQQAVQAAAPAVAAPAAAAVVTEEVAVIFKSTPVGADISVDSKYVGSTPSTVRVPAGDHQITIEKSGYTAWKRNMTLKPGGEITVDAGLEKGQ
jgi:PEGA domain-containing protein